MSGKARRKIATVRGAAVEPEAAGGRATGYPDAFGWAGVLYRIMGRPQDFDRSMVEGFWQESIGEDDCMEVWHPAPGAAGVAFVNVAWAIPWHCGQSNSTSSIVPPFDFGLPWCWVSGRRPNGRRQSEHGSETGSVEGIGRTVTCSRPRSASTCTPGRR